MHARLRLPGAKQGVVATEISSRMLNEVRSQALLAQVVNSGIALYGCTGLQQ